MLNKAEVQAVKHICLAQFYSKKAKEEIFGKRRWNYNEKQQNIDKAINILNKTKSKRIKYAVITNVPDQNGNNSNIYFFEVTLQRKHYQISFHGFDNVKEKGHLEILWDKGCSIDNAKELNKKFNFGIEF